MQNRTIFTSSLLDPTLFKCYIFNKSFAFMVQSNHIQDLGSLQLIICEQKVHTPQKNSQWATRNIISDLKLITDMWNTLKSHTERQNKNNNNKCFVCSSDMHDVTGFSTALANPKRSTEAQEK